MIWKQVYALKPRFSSLFLIILDSNILRVLSIEPIVHKWLILLLVGKVDEPIGLWSEGIVRTQLF